MQVELASYGLFLRDGFFYLVLVQIPISKNLFRYYYIEHGFNWEITVKFESQISSLG